MSNVTTADLILVSCGGVTFLGVVILMGVYLYWGYTRMDKIMDEVKGCKLISRYKFYLRMGVWGRVMLVAGVAGCLAFPGYLIKHGQLSSEDIDRFSEPLKSKLILSHHVAWGLAASLVIEWGVMEIIR
ncbi:hypothetical protein [Pseudomonas sp. GW531-T4]|uniref:hypothetical protein n=1 Tax=Pseudomonas sp. GW531-T4 TaxID=2075553 RepID=UPI000CCFE07F|nr:hypothetical protein [Pseudomonas sp. GW531-T4]POA62930.1 hypothetical protein C1888_29765 [Pseudomonas sp. GW531-T4]